MFNKLIMASFCLAPFFGVPLKAEVKQDYVKIADDLLIKSSKRLAQKHGLHFCGISGGMMGCVKLMGVTYQLNRAMKKNEARAVIVNCVQEILADINQNEPIRKYLQVYPFDPYHLEVSIFFSTTDHGKLFYPDLSVVTAYNGIIDYATNDPDDKFKYKTQEVESFEDAVKIVQSQNPPQKLAE